MFWYASGLEIQACPAKLADSGDRTPSNAMAVSMPSLRECSKWRNSRRPPEGLE